MPSPSVHSKQPPTIKQQASNPIMLNDNANIYDVIDQTNNNQDAINTLFGSDAANAKNIGKAHKSFFDVRKKLDVATESFDEKYRQLAEMQRTLCEKITADLETEKRNQKTAIANITKQLQSTTNFAKELESTSDVFEKKIDGLASTSSLEELSRQVGFFGRHLEELHDRIQSFQSSFWRAIEDIRSETIRRCIDCSTIIHPTKPGHTRCKSCHQKPRPTICIRCNEEFMPRHHSYKYCLNCTNKSK